jgi:ADP-ribose pyrophosphatase YjhB (NUDIX family)
MLPCASFRFCPGCGASLRPREDLRAVDCAVCGYHLHFNPAVSVAPLVVRDDGALLLIRRAREPARGKLGVPGGFVDAGESAEHALRRELREELGREIDDADFLGGFPNVYPYRDLVYPVLDLYYLVRLRAGEMVAAPDEVSEWVWRDPDTLTDDELAFPSLVAALSVWQAQARRDSSGDRSNS